MSRETKKQNIEMALDDKLNEINEELGAFHKILESQFEAINTTLEQMENLQFQKKIIINIEEEEADISTNLSELINIIEYKENEIISFETNLFPNNYHKMEGYNHHTKTKNRIRVAVLEKLKEINYNTKNGTNYNSWDKAIVIFEIKKEGRIADFDNYFMKPYVDGIVLSGFLKNDTSDNLDIIYKDLDSKKQLVRVTLIKKGVEHKYIKRYFNIKKNVDF
ncbi:hypothetical protein [Clostridium thermobutyricum]|uniref:hypothetical protein n=1 Tax=Clostridium thermobutyricum TaxID=29372 RepID=UPI0018A94543|nr:hypothetical protein [Clostridium thermobutyricum]